MKTVAITGASGFVGGHLVRAFVAADWRVVGLCRRPSDQPAVAGVAFRRFDLAGDADVDLAGVDALIHCALEPYRDARSDSVNVAGSRRLFELARSQGVARIVFISSTAARAQTQSDYGRDKFAIEELLDPARDTIVRPGMIVGNGGIFRAMVDSMRKTGGLVPLFFGGKQPVYTVGIDDLTRAIVELVNAQRAGTYVLAAPEPVTMKSLYEQIGDLAGVKVRLVPLPYGPVLGMLRVAEKLGVRLPLSSGSVRGIASMQRIEVPRYGDLGVPAPLSSVIGTVDFSRT